MSEQLIAALQRSGEMEALREANIALTAENDALRAREVTVQEAARVLSKQGYIAMEPAFDAMDTLILECADSSTVLDAALRALAGDDQ